MPRDLKIAGTCLVIGAAITGAANAQEEVFIPGSEVPAEETAAAVSDPNWQLPRTSWGHPNLEGTWSTDDMRSVPRERPEEFGTRERLTLEEFEERASSDNAERHRVLNEAAWASRSWGIRTFGFTSQIVDPPNGRIPEMTAAGKARAGRRDRGTFGPGPFDSFEDFTLYDRCITRGILGSQFPVVYGNGQKIVQTPDTVAITYEMIHDTRIIKLDGRPHMDDGVRQYLGNSRGYWDGDTLVVETRNLTDRTSIGGNGNGTRHSDQMKLTERYTRIDPGIIEYVAVVEDPVTYTAPFTVRLMLTSQPGYTMFEYSCHEGNGAIDHSLSGERAYERRVAEAIANGEPVPERIPSASNLEALPDDETVFIDINAGE